MHEVIVADFKQAYDNVSMWSQEALNKVYEQMTLERNLGNLYVYCGDSKEENICGKVKSVSMNNWQIKVFLEPTDTPKGRMLDATLKTNNKFELGICVRLKRRTHDSTTLLSQDIEFDFLELEDLAKEPYIDTTILNLDTCKKVKICYGYSKSTTQVWTKIYKKKRAKWYHLRRTVKCLSGYKTQVFQEPYGYYNKSVKDIKEHYREEVEWFLDSKVEYRNIPGTDKVEAITSTIVPTRVKIRYGKRFDTILETHDPEYAKEVFDQISNKIKNKYEIENED